MMNQAKGSPTEEATNDTPSTRSDGCKCLENVGRNLVVCIDGTSNQFGEKVYRLRSFWTLVVAYRPLSNLRTRTLSSYTISLRKTTAKLRSTTVESVHMQGRRSGHGPFTSRSSGTRSTSQSRGKHSSSVSGLPLSLRQYFRNFEKTVLSAYQWLSERYHTGDRIFLFGKRLSSLL